jgi:hypothetical protein
VPLRLFRAALAASVAMSLAACGSSHDHYTPPVAGLGLQLTRVGPDAVRLDWSYDPIAYSYAVSRDGYPLATVSTTNLIDASAYLGGRYCWQVSGLGASGQVVSVSSTGCMTMY